MMKCVNLSLAVLLLLACHVANAQRIPPTSPDQPSFTVPLSERRAALQIYPQAAWYSADEGGRGWYMSDVHPAVSGPAFLSIAHFGYDEGGRPLWMSGASAKPPFKSFPTPLDFVQGSVLSSFTAEVVYGSGGACPNCSHVPPVISSTSYSYGPVKIDWVSPAFARLNVGGREMTPLQPGDLLVGPSLYDRLVAGTHEYTGLLKDFSTTALKSIRCNVRFRPVANPAPSNVWELQGRAQTIPPVNARWLQVEEQCLIGLASSGVLPEPTGPFNLNPYFVAVPDRADQRAAVFFSLATGDTGFYASPAERINAPNGDHLGFRLREFGRVVWLVPVDAKTIVGIGALQYDRNEIREEFTMRLKP